MHTFNTLLVASLPLVSAHFKLNYPPARGFDEDTLPNKPCGGQAYNPSAQRTQFPLSGAPIQLDLGHTQSDIQVFLAIGNDPQEADFTHIIVPTFAERGPNNFCLGAGAITLPSDLNITSGTNATIQVVTNGDDADEPGLYNCADVTFTSTKLSTDDYNKNCQNSTGVSVSVIDNKSTDANGTSPSDTMQGMTSSTASGSSTASSSALAAAQATMVSWGLGAVGAVGAAIGLAVL